MVKLKLNTNTRSHLATFLAFNGGGKPKVPLYAFFQVCAAST